MGVCQGRRRGEETPLKLNLVFDGIIAGLHVFTRKKDFTKGDFLALVGCAWLAYQFVGEYILDVLVQIKNGVIKMTLIEGIPAEYETGIVVVSLLISLMVTYLVAITRKGDYDKKNETVSEWSKRWIVAAFASVAAGTYFGLIFTPWAVGLLDGGYSFGQFAIAATLASALVSWIAYVLIAEGPVEALKDSKRAKDYLSKIKKKDSE